MDRKCLSCEYFDYDEETDTEGCTVGLDEDDMLRFMTADTAACPYYKFFDEYKMVRKQN
ncbi:MAG: hypothetical protein IKK83_05860 [Clostridia bacterium]|nr:hypothetical protein [Clostridia bacterium]